MFHPSVRLFLAGIIAFFVFCGSISAQLSKHGNIWRFGNRAGLDFSSGQPVKVTNVAMDSYEGCASYCDSQGNLLFYTNGGGSLDDSANGSRTGTIWNRNGQVMFDLGTTKGGGYSAAQSSIFIPNPANSNQYYLFTMDHEASLFVMPMWPNRGLSYFMLDRSLNGGLGGVTQEDVRIFTPAAESLTAIRHSNGIDFWILTLDRNSLGIVVVPVTAAGVGAASIYPRNGPSADRALIMKASPDGHWLCVDSELYTFDATTGKPVFQQDVPTNTYSFSFSPSSRYLYTYDPMTLSDIFRYDLASADISNSGEQINTDQEFSFFGEMQIGPDGNIYVIEQLIADILNDPPTVSLTVIQCPDGTEPTLQRSLYQFDTDILNAGGLFTSLPNFADYIFATSIADTSEVALCDTVQGFVLKPQTMGQKYLWSTGATTPQISANAPGIYSVEVQDSCSNLRTVFEVEAGNLEVKIEAAPLKDTCAPLPRRLQAIADGATTYLWSDGSKADTLIIKDFRTYTVTVTGLCGTSTATYTQTEPATSCCKVFQPNAFTPNGDSANDLFSPVLLYCDVEYLEFNVYSRWGELVFQGYTPTERWDGTTLNGTQAMADIYAYTFRYKLKGEGEEKSEKGQVTLLR